MIERVVAGDRRRCEVRLRGLPKENGGIGAVPVGGWIRFPAEKS